MRESDLLPRVYLKGRAKVKPERTDRRGERGQSISQGSTSACHCTSSGGVIAAWAVRTASRSCVDLRSLQDQVETILAAQSGHGRGSGPQHAYIGVLAQVLAQQHGQLVGPLFGGRFVFAADDDADHRAEGRVAELGAVWQFLLGKAHVVVSFGGANRRMVRTEGLHVNAAALFAAAGAPRDLRDQLKRAFRGPEIGQVQCRIGVDHADQRDVGEVQPFSDHLSAQQHLDFAATKSRERFLVAAGFAHRVGVHPQASGARNRSRTSASSRCVPSPL